MSLLPYFLDRSPFNLLNSQLNWELEEADVSPLMSGDFLRPWSRLSRGLGSIRSDNSKFEMSLDVHHFAPEEIDVKTVDGFVVVEGRHEEKKDEHGWVSRQFRRRYTLPEGCNIESVKSRLSSDGVLTVTAPLQRGQGSNERIVPIVQTGAVRKQARDT